MLLCVKRRFVSSTLPSYRITGIHVGVSIMYYIRKSFDERMYTEDDSITHQYEKSPRCLASPVYDDE